MQQLGSNMQHRCQTWNGWENSHFWLYSKHAIIEVKHATFGVNIQHEICMWKNYVKYATTEVKHEYDVNMQ